MPGESLSFPITAEDHASGKFKDVGNAAAAAAGKIDLAAKALDLWDDTAVKSARATDTMIRSQLAAAKADAALARAQKFIAGEGPRVAALMLASGTAAGGRGGGFGRFLRGVAVGGGALLPGAAAGTLPAGAGAAGLIGTGTGGLGVAAAALAALPFLAQAAGSAIVGVLGNAFTGIAIIGASKFKSVKDSFADVARQANFHLTQIGKPFVPVVNGILKAVRDLMRALTPAFVQFSKIVGPPFEAFGKTLVGAFAQPAVKQSIVAIGHAFGDLLKAFTPTIPGIIKGIALGFTAIAKAVAANPRAFVLFVSLLGKLAGLALQGVAALIRIADYIEKHFEPAMHRVAVIFDGVRHDIAHIWDQIYNNTIGTVIRFAHNVETQFNSIRHGIASTFDGVRHTIASWLHDIAHAFDQFRHFQGQAGAFEKDISWVWDRIRHATAIAWDAIRHLVASVLDDLRHIFATMFDKFRHDIAASWAQIWAQSVSQTKSGTGKVVEWFKMLPGRVIGAMFGLGHRLYAFGRAALSEFWNGLKSIGGSVLSWVGNFVKNVWDKVSRFFGFGSPSKLFYNAGKNLMLGLFHGIKDHAHHAVAAARAASQAVAAAAGARSGVGFLQAGSVIAMGQRMAAAYGWTGVQWTDLFNLWQRESGWNPAARNPSSGAAGIPQDITGNFHGGAAGQIAWGLNYIRGRYGTPAAAWAHELAFNWYGGGLKGGLFTRPTLIGVGERGPEMVSVTPGRGGHGGGTVIVNVHVGHGTNPVQAAREIADILNYGATRGVHLRRSILSANG